MTVNPPAKEKQIFVGISRAKSVTTYVTNHVMSWMYAAGMVFGVCLAGAECESLAGTAMCGLIGLLSAGISGALFIGELDRMARRGIK